MSTSIDGSLVRAIRKLPSERTLLIEPVPIKEHYESSLARLGMQIHLTAPHAHAGWAGTLIDDLLQHNAKFQALVARSKAGPFLPFEPNPDL